MCSRSVVVKPDMSLEDAVKQVNVQNVNAERVNDNAFYKGHFPGKVQMHFTMSRGDRPSAVLVTHCSHRSCCCWSPVGMTNVSY